MTGDHLQCQKHDVPLLLRLNLRNEGFALACPFCDHEDDPDDGDKVFDVPREQDA